MGRFLRKNLNLQNYHQTNVFYSSIKDGKRDKSDGHISNEPYFHLKDVWNKFEFKPFKDFHDHYLKKKLLFLADVFGKLISACLEYYNLDPCHYFSNPGLSWDAKLKMTAVELEKINNADMHIFIEKRMRGGVSCASKRHSKANNKYCPDNDETKPEKWIHYLDMNNLYGQAMSEYLPYGGFKWVRLNNEAVNRILNRSDNSLYGYFLEVDLDYPEH